MRQIQVETERTVTARPEDVFRFLADYRDKRPSILTKDYSNFQVVKGGRGSGTIFTYTFHTARGDRLYEMRVEEPAKNTLLERDTRSSLTTTWRVAPTGDSGQSRVSIVTEWAGASGIGGFFERTFAPASLKKTYMSMLDRVGESFPGAGASRAAG